MLRRLPVSLRFDDDDTDFYYGFIEPKKNDRELSSLILDLLHVYHENEIVRDIVDEYVTSKSPYLHIHKELERIALEHSRNSVSASILGDFNDNARKKVSEPPEPVRKEEEVKEEQLMLSEAKIQEMVQKSVTETLGKMLLGSLNLNDIGKAVTDNVENQLKENNVVVEQPKIVEPPKVVEQPRVVETPKIVEPPKMEVEAPKRTPVPPVVEGVSLPPVRESQSQNQVKKPASFSKLMGSMK